MKTRRRLALLATLALAACGSKEEQAQKKTDLTLPITAPMSARDHLLKETRKANDAAREREKQFDSLINR